MQTEKKTNIQNLGKENDEIIPETYLEELSKLAQSITCYEELLQAGLYMNLLSYLETKPFLQNQDDAIWMYEIANSRGKALSDITPEELMENQVAIYLFIKYQDDENPWFDGMKNYFEEKPTVDDVTFIWNYNNQELYNRTVIL